MIETKKSPWHRHGVVFILLLVSVLPFFQLGEYTVQRYWPALFSALLFSLISLILIMRSGTFIFQKNLFVLIIAYTPIIFIPLFVSESFSELIFNFIKLLLPLILFIAYFKVFSYLNQAETKLFLNIFIYLSLMIGFIETFLRFNLGQNIGESIITNFYIFKMDSPFFTDSNAAGIFYLSVLSLILGISWDSNRSRLILSILVMILIILSLSRACIIAALFIVILKIIIESRFWVFMTFFVVALIISPFLLFEIYNFVYNDPSGATKLQAYSVMFSMIGNGDVSLLDLLFGVGINEGSIFYGYEKGEFSHAYLPMLVGQVGLVGLFFYCLFLVFTLVASWQRNIYLIVGLFICGLSYIHPFYEFIFLVLGILTGIEKKHDLNFLILSKKFVIK